jgi:hypothetical protein
LSRKIFSRAAPALAAFSLSAVVALKLAGGLAEQAYNGSPAQPSPALAPVLAPVGKSVAKADGAAPQAPQKQAANPYGSLFDPEGSLVGVPALFAQSEPIGPAFSPLQSEPLFVMVDPEPATQVADIKEDEQPQVVERAPAVEARPQVAELEETPSPEAEASAPVPPTRPAELSAPSRVAEAEAPARVEPVAPQRHESRVSVRERARAAAQPTATAQNDPRSFFDKLFGSKSEQKGEQLAYANPDGGLFGMGGHGAASPGLFKAGNGTAVYDISRHTVYLPGGQALEAHSGLGPYFDDPGHVHLRMRGATPPAVYNLTLRESLFHGVQALRLNPVSGTTFGRSGLLAHTFMLGQRGDSNGCVSFRNYRAFLQAYQNGEVRRLVVVPGRG